MLWHEHIKSWFPAFTRTSLKFFRPESSQNIWRLQLFWLGCGAFIIVMLVYGILTFLFEKSPLPQQEEEVKVTTTSIETATKKINLDEAFRHGIESKLKMVSDEIGALKTLIQEGGPRESVNREGSFSQGLNGESMGEDQTLNPSFPKNTIVQELETKILHLEEQLEMYKTNTSSLQTFQSQGGQGDSLEGHPLEGRPLEGTSESLIQKVSLGLTENLKHKAPHLMRSKTVDTTIPAGAFAKTVLLSGLDASSAMTASSDPRPMLLRVINFGTLPRRFQSDLKDCHCTASAYGDLSSERVYARLEKLTCIERKSGEIIETQVAGYIAGSDGKAGIRGIVASKDGQFLARSLMGGMFAGLSNVANPQDRQSQVNPFFSGSSQVSPPSIGETFTSGMATGATTALDRLSQYYIDRAEQLQPVIQVAAGQVVDIVFTEGTFIGSQSIKSEIEKEREDARTSTQKGKQNDD